jgi:hypothetical protein
MLTRGYRCAAVLAAAIVLGGACTTSGDDTSTTPGATGDSGATTTLAGGGATATGVTADSITIGFSYIDLETLAEAGVIKISHGPYEDVIKALVDDVNANGGINGRRLELVIAKYSPIGNEEQLAACSKLTEDEKAFAVLNGLLNENNLCIVQQHATILVNGASFDASTLELAQAPWATYAASNERRVAALVRALDEAGALEGKNFALYAAQAANEPLLELAAEQFEAAGYTPTDSALLDVPDDDTQAADAQNKVFAQRFMDQDVEVVINVGLFIPGAIFDSVGYHPEIYVLDTGSIAAAAFTNPLGEFPVVAGLAATPSYTDIYDNAEFTRCREVYEAATGKRIENPIDEDLAGESTGYTAMTIACTDMQIFVAAATAAGPNLTNETFLAALESLGEIELANTPVASFGPGKTDAQDSFVLMRFDPTWKEGEGREQFIAMGDPFVLE